MARTIGGRFRLTNDPPRKGGFSLVYKAYDLDVDPPAVVGIKLLTVGETDDVLANALVAREDQSLYLLNHENIVRLIDSGVDDDTGDRYLALEWVESSLDAYLDGSAPTPDDFISAYGLKITAAMAYSHEVGVAHRDLKPGNVLISADGIVKLADFGISKILDALQPDDPNLPTPTLRNFHTPPYAAPEQNLGAMSRDVWGLGATLLSGLTRRFFKEYDELRLAAESLDVPAEVATLVRDCLHDDPNARPHDARVVHARLEAIWRKHQLDRLERRLVYVAVTASVSARIDADSIEQAASTIIEDLVDIPAICSTPNDADAERHYKLYGSDWLYRAVIETSDQEVPRIVLIGAYPLAAGELERARDQGVVLAGYQFTAQPLADRALARSVLRGIVEDVERNDLELQFRIADNEADRVLDQWKRQIDARSKLEQRKERPIPYRRVSRQGRRAEFHVRDDLSTVEVGEIRRALGPPGSAPLFVRGEVDSIDNDKLTLYLDDAVEGIPSSGRLIVDNTASQIKIRRERAAVEVLANDPSKAARPDLAELIFNPGAAEIPRATSIVDWESEKLDESKQRAIEAALGSKDFYLVQGPPGTGKTTFIAELVVQELRRNPSAKILISSQTNVALDNALHRIHKLGASQRILRLADPRFGRVSPDAEQFRVERQLEKWCDQTTLRSQAYSEAWISGRGVSLEVVETSRIYREWSDILESESATNADLRAIEGRLDALQDDADPTETAEELDEQIQDVLDRAVELERVRRDFEKKHSKILSGLPRNDLDPDELRKMADDALGGLGVAKELRSLVRLQSEWQLRLKQSDGFVPALANDSAIVGATCTGLVAVQDIADLRFDLCIIDECSKATATETLIPIVRSSKWVLVGDERQLPPMVEDALRDPVLKEEFGLDDAELRLTLFSRLAQGLPMGCQTMLTEQHRMVPAIGDLISECFYDGCLRSVGPRDPGAIAEVFPKPVAWHDTSRLEHRRERFVETSRSYVNVTEAAAVRELARRLDAGLPTADERRSLLVLAPYSAQVDELKHQVRQLGEPVRLKIEVNTVDAVQGREADYVIFSVTRSNDRLDAGFLSIDARANVALSRAKFGLAIVGDLAFCRMTHTPFEQVASYISSHHDACVRLEIRA